MWYVIFSGLYSSQINSKTSFIEIKVIKIELNWTELNLIVDAQDAPIQIQAAPVVVPFGGGGAAVPAQPAVVVAGGGPGTQAPQVFSEQDTTKNFNDQIISSTRRPLNDKDRLPAWFKLLRDKPADDQQ